jgi:hypothetical protein
MTIYYDYNEEGELIQVSEENRRHGGGLKLLSSKQITEYSEGKFTETGWLICDKVQSPTHYSLNDSLGGVNGVFNPADGKTYDSRSAYINAVKAKGLEIVGTDAPTTSKPKPKQIDWRPAVAETLKQLKPTNKRGR